MLRRLCKMCDQYATHTYLDDKITLKGLFPEVDWKEIYICEKCAQRESGKKHWKDIKRNLK